MTKCWERDRKNGLEEKPSGQNLKEASLAAGRGQSCGIGHKKTRRPPRNCGNFSLTKFVQDAIMNVHTVVLCLFLDFTSNMVILAQEGAAVKG